MSFFLSKLIPIFLFPLGLGITLGALSLLWRMHPNRLKATLIGLIAVLWIPAAPITAKHIHQSLEKNIAYLPPQQANPRDAIVILGGGIASPAEPNWAPLEIGESSDRALGALRLFHKGKAPVIIITGGDGTTTSEADSAKKLLIEWGMEADAIIAERHSRNTYENGIFTKKLLQERGLDSIFLVTSACHMKRALAVFKKQNINALPYPVDFHARNEENLPGLDYLPDAGALHASSLALKEHIGYLYYWLRGWL